MVQKLFIQILLLVLFCFVGNAQMFLADVEFERLNEGAIEEYVQRQISNNKATFSDVKPSLEPSSSTLGYKFHEREYVVKDSLNKVWTHYIFTNPGDAWNIGKVNFGMLFSKRDNAVIYPNEEVDKIETGQIVYLNLNLLRLKTIATAFEIIKVDEQNNVIEFSYVEDNTTHGKQQLNFVSTQKGYTKIIHRSYFKSQSVLRDHFLYPYFHTRLTNTYHRNMKKMYKSKNL